jgi:hypothetical protein
VTLEIASEESCATVQTPAKGAQAACFQWVADGARIIFEEKAKKRKKPLT